MKILMLANTPYHLYISFIITRLAKEQALDIEADLLLIGHEMEKLSGRLIASRLWNHVHAIRDVVRNNENQFAPILNVGILRHTRRILQKYFIESTPDRLIAFIDHNVINATIIDLYRKDAPKGKVILIEEGTGTYIQTSDNQSHSTNLNKGFKYIIKKMLGIGNAKRRNVGRVCHPDISVVTDRKYVASDYTPDALFIEWPSGPYPHLLSKEFYKMMEFPLLQQWDANSGILLGEALSEDEIMSEDEEREYIQLIGEISRMAGVTIMVKPHPREKKDKSWMYKENGLIYLDESRLIPTEIMFSIYHPRFVISIFSYASINYTLRCKGRSFWLESWILKQEPNALIQKLMTDRSVLLPNNPSEWISMLESPNDPSEGANNPIDYDEQWKETVKQIITK